MTHPIPCVWNGIWYLSISEAANAQGISFVAMRERLHKDMSSDNDLKRHRKKPWDSGLLKRCSKCGGVKLLSEFHSDKSQRDGLSPWCKDCNHQKYLQWKARNKASQRKSE